MDGVEMPEASCGIWR